MFINLPKKQNILSVDNQRQFYTLIDEDDTHLTYKIFYNIDVMSAIRAGSAKIKILIANYEPPILEVDDSVLNTSIIENQVRAARRNRKNAIRNKRRNTFKEIIRNSVLELSSDLFFQVKNFLEAENRDVPRINGIVQEGNGLSFIKNKTVLSRARNINNSNQKAAILDQNTVTPDEALKLAGIPKASFFTDLITKKFIDPASVADLNNDIVTYSSAIAGIRDKQHIESKDKNLSFLKKVITINDTVVDDAAAINNQTLQVPVRKKVKDNLRLYSQLIKIKKDLLNNNKFQLSVELVDEENVTVDSISQSVSVDSRGPLKYKLIKPPHIDVKVIYNGKVRITLRQNDKNAKGISIYQKIIQGNEPDLIKNKYRFLGSFEVNKANDFFIKDFDTITNNFAIYRAFSYDTDGNNSLLFSSKVIGANKNAGMFGSALEARISEEGIAVEVNEYPPGAVSVAVIRRDVTLNEKIFSVIEPVGEQIRLTGDTLNKTFTDNRVKNNHTYEYSAKFYYRDGTVKQSGNSIIEYIPLSKTKTFTRLEVLDAVQETPGTLGFGFSIITEIPEEDLDLIRTLLEKNGISEFFNDVQLAERDRFRDILAYNVTRTNLTTGQKESFGNISTTQFSDRVNGEAAGVKPLENGNVYRYEVRTLLRVPETLFEKFQKKANDRNGVEYTYLPFKFKHPVALKLGNIPTKDSLKSNYAKTQMDFGDIGDSVETLLSLKNSLPSLYGANTRLVNENTAAITWTISGDISLIDHFLIVKQSFNSRAIIGKAHSNIDDNNFTFFYELTKDDVGEISFAILPVYNDYSFGIAKVTNPVAHSE